VKIESGSRTDKASSHKKFAENLTADLLKCSNAARRLGYSHRTHLERLEPRPGLAFVRIRFLLPSRLWLAENVIDESAMLLVNSSRCCHHLVAFIMLAVDCPRKFAGNACMARLYNPLKSWSTSSSTIQLMTFFRSARVETCCKRRGFAAFGELLFGGSWWALGMSII
jgi:hypothetical protein